MTQLTIAECKQIIIKGKKQLTAAEKRIEQLESLVRDMRRSLQAAYHVNMLDFPTPYDERMAELGLMEGDKE